MNELLRVLDEFKGKRALVIGDAINDTYHFGAATRLAPEGPIPVFVEEYDRCEVRRGGADNVAHQLEALGFEVQTVFADRRSVKHRYFIGNHMVFRRDSDSKERAIPAHRREVEQKVKGASVIVLSDYAKGFLTDLLCHFVMHRDLPVIVDPKGTDWEKYQGAHVFCPNQHELEAFRARFSGAGAVEALCPLIFEKRGAEGITVHQNATSMRFPAPVRTVFDVTGAGDIVTALVAACAACEASVDVTARLANIAAGYAVGQLGTAVCPMNALRDLALLEELGMRDLDVRQSA
jgi:D-beta-D-heptose 7-phosphate kinase/D-beta-D-heptose 1-phosphate adenosyltransferase